MQGTSLLSSVDTIQSCPYQASIGGDVNGQFDVITYDFPASAADLFVEIAFLGLNTVESKQGRPEVDIRSTISSEMGGGLLISLLWRFLFMKSLP